MRNLPSSYVVFLLMYLLIVLLIVINSDRYWSKLVTQASITAHISYVSQSQLVTQASIPSHIIQVSRLKLYNSDNLSFVRLNPNYTYYSFGDKEAEEFIQEHMPSNVVQVYKSMPKVIFKSDFFRYIAMMVLGGVYSDMDTECLHPIDTWIVGPYRGRVGLIISIEWDNITSWASYARPFQFCQWTFAGVAGHPILRNVVEKIVTIAPRMLAQNISYGLVMNWTGPGIWTDVILDYIRDHHNINTSNVFINLQHPVLIGDIYILPKDTFNSYARRTGKENPDTFVRHRFKGSWKKDKAMITTKNR